ncbi:hypothetical protein LCGC14_1108860 [marine sediment metagenome]|uniref:Uncharacterized protein n=1 Tax=marine sediment metagenome TaxID=412755 RepID=A0A0F9PQJ1_9ZZZZ
MINYPDVIMIGLGHRARNGKDTVANMLKEQLGNVEIIHWADGVYEECTNRNTAYPLIKQEFTGPSKIYYSVLDDKQTGARIAISNISDPFLHNIFTKRNITEYQGMISKDPEILQFWGTNFRRTLCDPNYWVKLTMKKANTLALNMDRGVIIIPDTRFINEAEAVTINKGFYVRVVRIKEDGSQYIADDRDPNHPSEAELEGYPASSTLTAKNIPELQIQVHNFCHDFIDILQTSQIVETK